MKVIDTQGNSTKDHGAVIVTTASDYKAGKPIQAVYISSKLHHTSDDYMAPLDWDPRGHPQTGLTQPSSVICDWRNKNVDEENILNFGKMVYGTKMDEIMEKVLAAQSKKSTQ